MRQYTHVTRFFLLGGLSLLAGLSAQAQTISNGDQSLNFASSVADAFVAAPSTPAPPVGPTISCSGTFTATTGANALYSCGGDLSVTQGLLGADQSVTLQADGNIYLDELTILAPSFNVYAKGTVTLESKLNASGDVTVSGRSEPTGTSPLAIDSTGILLGSGVALVHAQADASKSASGSLVLTSPADLTGITGLSEIAGSVAMSGDGGLTLTSANGSGGSLTFINAASGTIPEPSTCALMGLGLLGIAAAARRRA